MSELALAAGGNRGRSLMTAGSFILPILLWCLISYVPFLWHPKVMIEAPGGVDYFQPGMLVDQSEFSDQLAQMKTGGMALPTGTPANPIYLPAPHLVAKALYTGFTTVTSTFGNHQSGVDKAPRGGDLQIVYPDGTPAPGPGHFLLNATGILNGQWQGSLAGDGTVTLSDLPSPVRPIRY